MPLEKWVPFDPSWATKGKESLASLHSQGWASRFVMLGNLRLGGRPDGNNTPLLPEPFDIIQFGISD